MILGERESALRDRCTSTVTVQPGGSDKSGDRTTDRVFNDATSKSESPSGFLERQSREFAFARRQVPLRERRG